MPPGGWPRGGAATVLTVLVGPLLPGSGHGREDLLNALHGIAAMPTRCQDARQLAGLGPREDRARAHLEPACDLGGPQEDFEVVRGERADRAGLRLVGMGGLPILQEI